MVEECRQKFISDSPPAMRNFLREPRDRSKRRMLWILHDMARRLGPRQGRPIVGGWPIAWNAEPTMIELKILFKVQNALECAHSVIALIT